MKKKSQMVTTRELLRNFKEYKDLLTSGQIDTIKIPISTDQNLNLSLAEPKNTAKNIIKKLREIKRPIKIKRTNVFDEWIQ